MARYPSNAIQAGCSLIHRNLGGYLVAVNRQLRNQAKYVPPAEPTDDPIYDQRAAQQRRQLRRRAGDDA